MTTDELTEALQNARQVATYVERKRCADIVSAARFGDLDQDFRAIIFMIESGSSVEDLKRG